jgi:hypothetical protein
MKPHLRIYGAGFGILFLGIIILYAVSGLCFHNQIPYNHTNPIVYDNDSVEDAYTDELLMALHLSRQINLRGMITTVGGWSEPSANTEWLTANGTSGRQELVAKARRSGMTRAPTPVAGSMKELKRPASGRIQDTVAHRNPGTDLIIAQAHRASSKQPLVIVVGGPVTTVAEAFLLDPTITNRVIVAWNGADNWNGEAKPFQWATEIVLRNFRCVLFGQACGLSAPDVAKADLIRLPATELRQFMIDKELPHVHLPGGRDGDAGPVIPLITNQFIKTVERCRWMGGDHDGFPVLTPDADGNLWRVTYPRRRYAILYRCLYFWKGRDANRTAAAARRVATAAWWETMTNMASWGDAPAPHRVPFLGQPVSIPGRIQAGQFDEGGPGVAYCDTRLKNGSEVRAPYRVLERVHFAIADDVGGGYAVDRIEDGEWTEYSVQVQKTGAYRLSARVASAGQGGSLLVAFDGTNAASVVPVASTGGEQSWRTIQLGTAKLSAGVHVMRVFMGTGGFNLNWLECAETSKRPGMEVEED